MGLILTKSKQFAYRPLPKESPETILFYRRLAEREVNEIREKYGQQVYNKKTHQNDFEITDEKGFKHAMLSALLVDWAGFYADGTPPKKIPFTKASEHYDVFPSWMLNELINRALGISEDADIENLLVQKELEEASKKP